jgi:hypothetical protein
MSRYNTSSQGLRDDEIELYFKTFLHKDCEAFSWAIIAFIKLDWYVVQPGLDMIPKGLKPLNNHSQIYFEVEYLAYNTHTSITDLILQRESFLFSMNDLPDIAKAAPFVLPDDYTNEYSYTEQELNLKLQGHLPESLVFLITRFLQTNPGLVTKLLRDISSPNLFIASIINKSIRKTIRQIWQQQNK